MRIFAVCAALVVCSGEWATASDATVWMVFFTSHACPQCETAKRYVEALRAQYPLKVKSFDVERDKDYALFKRMEAIHGRTRFKAPLVMIGDEILIGNEEIISKLESLIQDQIRRGGAPLPYLGPDYSSAGEIVRGFLCGCSDRGKSTTGAHTWLSSGPTPRIQSISRLVALHSFP